MRGKWPEYRIVPPPNPLKFAIAIGEAASSTG